MDIDFEPGITEPHAFETGVCVVVIDAPRIFFAMRRRIRARAGVCQFRHSERGESDTFPTPQ